MIGLLVFLASCIPSLIELVQFNVFALKAHRFMEANSNRENTAGIRVFRLAFSLIMNFFLVFKMNCILYQPLLTRETSSRYLCENILHRL